MKKINIFTTLILFSFLNCCSLGNSIYVTSPTPANTYNGYQERPSIIEASRGTVTVQKGDTVYGLSRKHNVPLREFIAANKLKAPYNLNIGQKLKLPATGYHEVKKGDTVYSISRRYNVDMSSLVRINGIKKPYTITIGQRLRLPSSIVEEPHKKTATAAPKQAIAKTLNKTPKKNVKALETSYAAPARSGGKFAWPVKGKVILPFGTTGKGQHNDGINISGKRGEIVKASENGVVAYVGNELAGYGNLILVKHSEGWMSAYAHNDSISVKKGQKIVKGQAIAKLGSSGNVSSPQLHFELRKGSKAVNPVTYLAAN